MDFYEELGVSERAADAEIRRSYKRLTLLLHPDRQQQAPELRALAEAQMKRINEMIAILTDPEQRRAYDLSLRKSHVFVIQNIPKIDPWLRNNRGWILLPILLSLFAFSAWLIPSFDEARTVAKATAPLPAPPKTREDVVQTSGPGAATLKKRTQSGPEQPAGPLPPPEVGNTAPVSLGNGSAVVEDPLRDLLIPPAASSPAPTLSGRWVYTPDTKEPAGPKLYPAVYVELAISELNGALHGSYRSRYKLPDRASNPYVAFVFEGDPGAGTFAWRGESGAKGQVTLHLESADTLKINWFATTMGSTQSLGSGSATLYRFR